MAKRSVGLVKCEFIFDFDTDAALNRIEKNEKMRRTGQNPRRTGQRSENGGENESVFFRQEDLREVGDYTKHRMLIEL